MSNRPMISGEAARKAFVAGIRDLSRRHSTHLVFSDFCHFAAIAISNSVDRVHFDQREALYLQKIKRYSKDEMSMFCSLLANLVEMHEAKMADWLGSIFMELELFNHWKGQYFTPYEICKLMAAISLSDVTQRIEAEKYVSTYEPCSGAGAMIIAQADSLLEQDINYQKHMYAIAQDLDETAVHMTYLQMSLLHIPGTVIHGNSLATNESNFQYWVTPAHIVGGWDFRLNQRNQREDTGESKIERINKPIAIQEQRVANRRAADLEQMSLFEM